MNIRPVARLNNITCPYHAHNIYLHIRCRTRHSFASAVFVDSGDYLSTGFLLDDGRPDLWGSGTLSVEADFLISALVYGLADNILHQRTVLLFWFILGIIFYINLPKQSSPLAGFETPPAEGESLRKKHEKTSETGLICLPVTTYPLKDRINKVSVHDFATLPESEIDLSSFLASLPKILKAPDFLALVDEHRRCVPAQKTG